jgi:hypothetical protein
MEGKHARVGFRVLSTNLSGDEIARRAGLRPTRVGEIGQPVSHGLAHPPVRLETAWVVDSPLGLDHPLEDRLFALLDLVEPFARRLHWLGEGCLMHIFIGRDALTRTGECALLSPELLMRLATLPGEGVLVEIPEHAPAELVPV